jgi:RNA polymerase sigma-70 factor (ECF subfamily)
VTADLDLSTLVHSAQRGDTLAMDRLLDQLVPFVTRICGPIALADGPDAAQETLIAVMKALPSLRDAAALHGWVRTIAVREAIRAARRAHPDLLHGADALDAVPRPDDPQLRADVRDVLARLSPEHRAVLVLRDLVGLEESEAAAVLDIATGTVKSRLHRARAHFTKEWTR